MSDKPSKDQPAGGNAGQALKPVVHRGKQPVRRPDIDSIFSINPDGSRNAIHPADVRGRFQLRKQVAWVFLIGIYLAVPWIKIGERPLLLIDLPKRHFYLFGQTFNAQDFWLAFFFITGLGFSLFVIAGLWGRMWCGYACPQTVFLEGVFRRVERWIEGPPAARQKIDKAPLAQKFPRRTLKLVVFAALSLVITHSFLGFFMPVEVIYEAITASPTRHMTAFLFICIATTILFCNYTWFREQLCIAICPYGRLQGALYDPDTMLVGFDKKRGEPRGPAGSPGAKDCIDCYRCVSVCPTGIDIRNGTQLECVGCANCIDACDDVMTKLGRPTGLVRYDSQRAFETGERRFWRGRVVLYLVLMLLGIGMFTLALTRRRPFEANLSHARGTSYTVEGDRVHNVFELHLINKRSGPRTFHVADLAPQGAEIIVASRDVQLESLQDMRVPVHVFLSANDFLAGLQCQLTVTCDDPEGQLVRIASGPLLGPTVRGR